MNTDTQLYHQNCYLSIMGHARLDARRDEAQVLVPPQLRVVRRREDEGRLLEPSVPEPVRGAAPHGLLQFQNIRDRLGDAQLAVPAQVLDFPDVRAEAFAVHVVHRFAERRSHERVGQIVALPDVLE